MSPRRSLSLLVLALSCAASACGPNDADRTKMKEKMDIETKRSAMWAANMKNCARLGTESAAFNAANKEAYERIDGWWGGLSSTAKRKLIAENQAAWDAQSNALVHAAIACPNEVKVSVKQ